MDKNFHLHAGFACLTDIGKLAFASQHHAVKPEPARRFHAKGAAQRHLRAGVQAQAGKIAPRQRRHAQILHDHGIRARGVNDGQRVSDARHFTGLDERVYGHVHAGMVQMGVAYGASQSAFIKVDGAGARAIGRIAEIHGVCPAIHGGAQRLLVSGGAEQFGQVKRHDRSPSETV